ncbi:MULTISPECIES: M48 family metallopeptidase [unclassified Moorena]|uniref:M48 family metallopeptidase n=1 Tax=unclassified Moorena TaxID=2683338 RepID=UPI0013BF2C0D|nr:MULTISPECIES: M48 family metallopeptidase [unclassified Moorena]NEP66682.1 M48 family metalloprotease [Moorena sp. SIO3A5]NES40927.1 M48 family metalloprotease [Moorena sp. SIO2C4]NES82631.1 M48 family metalloprotease [Moorena sp. SIO2B7]NET66489.1 M48 family metalloprotease [Moorena sp. SIO1G6]
MLNPFFWIKRASHRRWFYLLIVVVVALGLGVGLPNTSSAFDSCGLDGDAGIEIIQLITISDQQELELGKCLNQQEVDHGLEIYSGREITEYVQDIGQRLIPYSDRPNFPYTFQVVRNNDINAFALVGGFVYVHTGLLKGVENEAELAAVIAHEIAHITSKHSIERLRQIIKDKNLEENSEVEYKTIINLLEDIAFSLPRGRQQEYEADRKGLEMLHRAGYAPSGMTGFLQKLTKGNTPAMLRTHPEPAKRLDTLKERINNKGWDPNDGDGLDSDAYKQRIKSLPIE